MLVLAPTVSGAMHIMEGFLPVKWAVAWYVLFIPFFV
ncbi:MAG: cobalamin biosynthesis protein CbiM, partial [Intestinibacter sp.]